MTYVWGWYIAVAFTLAAFALGAIANLVAYLYGRRHEGRSELDELLRHDG